mgnify:CR=1 FL=1
MNKKGEGDAETDNMSFPVSAILEWLVKTDGLSRELIKECKEYHIFAEEDLQFSCYYHIRKFLSKENVDDEDYWRVYNKKYIKTSSNYGKFPDLTLRRCNESKILIELKQTVGRSVTDEDIFADIKKLTEIGGEKELIVLYTCNLPGNEGNIRYNSFLKDAQKLNNMDKLHLVRVAVVESFGGDEHKKNEYLERIEMLNKRRDW